MNILIVGATSGIGYHLWRLYADGGNNVAVIGRRKNILEEMANKYPSNTQIWQCDISDVVLFSVVLKEIILKLGKLDLAIVCAGIGELNSTLDLEIELSTIAVNVKGWTNAVDSIYKIFEGQQSGHIVAITSVGGLQPTPIAPSYSASKAFQINYIKSLQLKSRMSSIFITEIRPGLVNTRMAKGEGLFWVMSVDKVAKEIVKAIKQKKQIKIITARWRVINWFLKHFK